MPLLHHETTALSLTWLIILGLPLAAAACARIVAGMRKGKRRCAETSRPQGR